MSDNSRAVSIRQPWAYAILHLGKDVENKPLLTHIRERILVHASKTFTREEREEAVKLGLDPDSLPRGCLVGSVEIYDCINDSDSCWAVDGAWHWPLRNPLELTRPVEFKGALGFIPVPPKVLKSKRWQKPKRLRKRCK